MADKVHLYSLSDVRPNSLLFFISMILNISERFLPKQRIRTPEQRRGIRAVRSKLLDVRAKILTSLYRQRISTGTFPRMSVALLHTGRVGSTVVAKQLEQHPDLTWDGEVFERLIDYRYRQQKADFEELLAEGLTPEELIRARMVVCSTNNYGLEIKVHPDQHLKKGVMNKNIKECVSMLSSIGFSKFIFLHRKNYLRQRISATVAAVQNQYFRQTKKAQLSRVEIKPQSDSSDGETFLLQEFETMDRVGSEVRREISSKDSLILSYEEDVLSDPRIAYSKICDYVGIRKVESKVTLKRTNPFKVSNMVVNYESVKRMLRGSKYEWMLDGK